MRLSQRVQALLNLAMAGVFNDQQWLIEENRFSFRLADVVLLTAAPVSFFIRVCRGLTAQVSASDRVTCCPHWSPEHFIPSCRSMGAAQRPGQSVVPIDLV